VAGTEDAVARTGEAGRPRATRLVGALRRRRARDGPAEREPEAADGPPAGGETAAAHRRIALRLPRIDAGALARRAALAVAHQVPAVAASVAAAIPLIRSTVNATNAGWVPAGDDGIIATRGWDVLTSHTPLVGQYSEAGLVVHGQVMHSPGPMLYWILALPAHFGSVASLAVTMCIVNTLSIIGCVVLARRRGGLVLMFAVAVGIALMCQSLPSESFHDIWNPAAGLLPFLLLIFVCWSLACGDHRLLPLAALLASYVAQTHLMYAAPTVVLLAVGLGGLLLGWLERRRRARTPVRHERVARRRVWPWALAALVLAAGLWTPPAIDEIENNPGNLTMIVRTVEHHGHALGSGVGWAAVVRSVGIRPWWLYVPASEWDRKYDIGAIPRKKGGPLAHPSSGEVASAIAILGALGVVGLFAAFMLQWDLAAAALIGLGMCAAIALEAASNPDTSLLAATTGYTMWWGSELGFWVWLVLAWALWLGVVALARPARRALRRYLRERRVRIAPWRLAAAGALSLACLGGTVAVGEAVAATEVPDSHHLQYRPVHTVAAALERAIPPGQTIEYQLLYLDLGTQPMEPAICFYLVRHGDRVLAQGSFPRLGSYYELYHRHVQWTVLLAQGALPEPNYRLVARVQFNDGWGHEVLSAWVRHAPPPAAVRKHAKRKTRRHRRHARRKAAHPRHNRRTAKR